MRTLVVVVAALSFSSVVWTPPARACGGMFCSSTSPTPIDQSAEKILFEVNDDGSVTATVEIKYNGNPRDFAWIVPVSGTPDFVEVAQKDELLLLDQATRPSILPPTTVCSNPPAQPIGFGCSSDSLSRGVDAAEAETDTGFDGVEVTQYPSVGPFDDIAVVAGGDPNALVSWLVEHDYQVSDEMRPFIEAYTLEGYSFLATRLRADAEVKDMVPIRFHCPQPNPEIPLRLTAIAAEPDMGFLVFVVGPERYELLNYANVNVPLESLQTSNGVTNYFPLVSKIIDEAGGRGFVVERAEDTAATLAVSANTFLGTEGEEAARNAVEAVLRRQRFVTRFFTRMSAEEMTEDPIFVPAATSTGFNGLFDLSARTFEACPADDAGNSRFVGQSPTAQVLTPPSAPICGKIYCGEGDACAASDQGEGCVCRGGHVARSTTAPSGEQQVICTSAAIDLHGGGNPCAGNNCGGAGTCIPINDRPTCRCNEGTVAVLVGASVQCQDIVGEVFESEQILWPQPPAVDNVVAAAGCTSVHTSKVGGTTSIALLFMSAALLRRLLRRGRP